MRSAKTSLVLSATVLLSAFVAGVSPARATEANPSVIPTTVNNNTYEGTRPQGSGTCAGNASSAQNREGTNQHANDKQSNGNTSAAADCSTTNNTNTNTNNVGSSSTSGAGASVGNTTSTSEGGAGGNAKTGDSVSGAVSGSSSNGTGGNAQGGSASQGVTIAPVDNSVNKVDARSDGRNFGLYTPTNLGNGTVRVSNPSALLICLPNGKVSAKVVEAGTIEVPNDVKYTAFGLSMFGSLGGNFSNGSSKLSESSRQVLQLAMLNNALANLQIDSIGTVEVAVHAFLARVKIFGLEANSANAIVDALRTAPTVQKQLNCGGTPPPPTTTIITPPPSTLQACFEVKKSVYEIRTWSSLENQPGFRKVENGLCFGRLGALPTVPSLQFVS